MANGIESNLLRLLQTMQEQNATVAREAKGIAVRCQAEHSGDHSGDSTAAANGNDGKSEDGKDVEMLDADTNGRPGEAKDEGPKRVTGSGDKSVKDGANSDFLCRSCYNDFLTIVYQAYAAPTQTQWYSSQKTTFLAELDRLLDDVRNLRAPLRHVEEWIAAQKRAWLLDQLQDAVAMQALGNAFEGKTELQAKLPDPDTNLSQLLRDVVTKIGTGERAHIIEDVKAAVKNLKEASDGTEQGTIYRDNLFPRGVPDVPAARALEKKLLDGSVGLDQGLRVAMRDLSGGDDEVSRAAKIEKHRKRLAELRRAKAAHEAQKLKKMKPVEVPYFLQDNTPCATCGKASDPQKSPFCITCFLEVDYCLRENQTVWCSASCMKENYASHFAANHPCAAGDRCARSKPEPDIARQEPRYFFCRECVLSFSISTFYCNDRCAGRDFQRHREKVHLPNREMRADYHDDRSDLSYSSFAKIDYTAADITRHLLSIDEAFSSCQKKHPDWDLTETKVQLTLPWPT